MLILLTVVVLLSSGALAAEINTDLTDWQLIERNVEKVKFPLSESVLQIKSARHVNHNNDPEYGNNTVVDKSTSMLLYTYSKGMRIGVVVWNTIPYVAGTDVIVFGCQAPYSRYRSDPCEGQIEQIWSWNFTTHGASLKCKDTVQYEVEFASSASLLCRRLGTAEIDELKFTNMAGFYYRSAPVVQEPEELKKMTTKPEFATTTMEPENIIRRDMRPTCDCWSRECEYCSNLECAVKYNLSSAEKGITVSSELTRRHWNHIKLYNGEGKLIGFFKWNLKAIFLEGCVFCRAPRRLQPVTRGEASEWNFSMVDGTITIKIGDEVKFQRKLRRGCAEYYKDVQYFAFQRMPCDNTYEVVADDMEPGHLMDVTCNGQCVD